MTLILIACWALVACLVWPFLLRSFMAWFESDLFKSDGADWVIGALMSAMAAAAWPVVLPVAFAIRTIRRDYERDKAAGSEEERR